MDHTNYHPTDSCDRNPENPVDYCGGTPGNAAMLRDMVMDTTRVIPTKYGLVNNIYFDNGGTTPPFKSVIEETEQYTPWYKYVSDKSAKAAFLSKLYESGRDTIKTYVGADMENDTMIYTKNTTEAINIVSSVICNQNHRMKPVILSTYMEHLSNYFPWKYRCNVVLVDLLPDGRLSMADLERKLKRYQGRVKLVTVAGAANVTGYINPIHTIAQMAHRYGAQILVDAAQLVQHRTVNMHPKAKEERIDFLAFSAHKIYAPFFTGALVGNKRVLDNGYPLCFGAGMEKIATASEIVLKKSPGRYEGGSNNLLGGIALATALNTIMEVDMDTIQQHESELLAYALRRLKQNPNVILYSDVVDLCDCVPIIAFNVRGKTHQEVARYLYTDYGIIVKNGHCGADLYVQKLTQGSPYDGVVRVSMALYNQAYEVDRLLFALSKYE